MTDLKDRECVPCSGKTAPLEGAAVKEFMQELPGSWKVVEDHHLEREYKFEGWRDAADYVGKAAELADQADHHPDLTLSYGKVKVKLFTHKIGGLSKNDFILAARLENAFTN